MIPLMKNAFGHEYETRQALAEFIMRAPRLSMDTQCYSFEREFAKYQGRSDAVLFNSGGSANLALIQALRNLDRLKEGDHVAFSALTWSTNTMPILQMGMTPVPIDCEPSTLNSMARHLSERIARRPVQALFITNALGFTGDLPAIRELCASQNIILIEDNCEALGTDLPEGRAGNFSLASTFSFFVAHHMSTIEGGMVCSDDPELCEMLRIVRANGWDRNLSSAQQIKLRRRHGITTEMEAKYAFYDLGYNLRPTEITGFLGLKQLQYLEENIAAREGFYDRLASVAAQNPDLVPLDRSHIRRLSCFAFVVLCRTPELRRLYIEQFTGAGVEIRPVIAGNIQKQPFYRKYVAETYEMPGADMLHDCGFYFGIYPELTSVDIEALSSCLTRH